MVRIVEDRKGTDLKIARVAAFAARILGSHAYKQTPSEETFLRTAIQAKLAGPTIRKCEGNVNDHALT